MNLALDCIVQQQETWQQDAVVAGAFVLIVLILVGGAIYLDKH